MSTFSERLIRSHTVFGGRGRFRISSMALTAELPFVMSLYGSARRTIMLRVVAPYVAEMLHLKSLTINRVAGVAGFQTMSTCNPYIKTLNTNVLVYFLMVFCAMHLVPLIPWERMAVRGQGAGGKGQRSDSIRG
jgi:hypothetical protein